MKQNELLKKLDRDAAHASFMYGMACIKGDKELMAKYEALQHAAEDAWLRIYKDSQEG